MNTSDVHKMPAVINREGAWDSSQFTNSDFKRTIRECLENGEDANATEIGIVVKGKKISEELFEIHGVKFTDNGDGMAHDIAAVRFRGTHHNSSPEHKSEDKTKRMGVGIQSWYRYFDTCFLETTTASSIPSEFCDWTEEEMTKEVRDIIPHLDKQQEQFSCLNNGDDDEEIRKYRFGKNIDDAEILEFSPDTTAEDHYTVVSWENPNKDIKVKMDIDDLERLISHRIGFLSRSDKDTKITLEVPCMFKGVKEYSAAMHKHHPIPSTVDANHETLCKITGSVKDGFSIINEKGDHEKDPESKLASFIKSNPNLANANIDMWIYKDQISQATSNKHYPDFVESINGSNIDDTWKSGRTRTERIDSLHKLCGCNYSGSIASRTHGAVWVNDIRLKRELVNNRSDISHDKQVVKDYYKLLSIIFSYVGNLYQKYTNGSLTAEQIENKSLEETLESLIEPSLKKIGKKGSDKTVYADGNGKKTKTSKTTSSNKKFNIENRLWACSCGIVWKAPKDNKPTICCEYAINSKKQDGGCGGSDIHPYHQNGMTVSDVKLSSQPISGYLTCVASIGQNGDLSFEIWKCHPKFLNLYFDQKKKCINNVAYLRAMTEEMKSAALVAASNDESIREYSENWLKGEWANISRNKQSQITNHCKNKIAPPVNIFQLLK